MDTNKTTVAPVVDPKKQARKDAKKAMRADQKKAFAALQEAIAKSADKNVQTALQAFVGLKVTRTGGSEGNPAYARFVKFVEEKKSVTEDVVFKEFKVGRKDCAGFIRKFLKNCDPKLRVWINFTPSDGVYKVIGTGVKAPAEYTGYVPTDDITDLKTPAAMK